MAGRGGARPNAGRKATPKKPAAVSKSAADEILDFLALQKNPHPEACRCLKCRWRVLSTAQDLRLRYQVEKSLLDRVLGLPAQAIDQTVEVSGSVGVQLVNSVPRPARNLNG